MKGSEIRESEHGEPLLIDYTSLLSFALSLSPSVSHFPPSPLRALFEVEDIIEKLSKRNRSLFVVLFEEEEMNEKRRKDREEKEGEEMIKNIIKHVWI